MAAWWMVPTDGMTVWLTPESIGSQTPSDAVTSWANEATSGAPATGASGTVVVGPTAQNGLYPIHFNSGYLDVDASLIRGDSTAGTVMLLHQRISGSGAPEFSRYVASTDYRCHWPWSSTTVYDRSLYNGTRTSFVGSDFTGGPHLATIRTSSTNTWRFAIDGTQKATRAHSFPAPFDTFRLGNNKSGGGYNVAYYWEVMYWTRDLTDTEVQDVHAYLNDKYALTIAPASSVTPLDEWVYTGRGSKSVVRF